LQQAEVVKGQSFLDVQCVTGKDMVESWEPEKWRGVAEKDVLVATPQVVYEALEKGFMKVFLPSPPPTHRQS